MGRELARELVAGAKAPAFTLARDGGTRVSLKDFKGRKLVLYFYPKADTPGCTKEAIAFSALRADFATQEGELSTIIRQEQEHEARLLRQRGEMAVSRRADRMAPAKAKGRAGK